VLGACGLAMLFGVAEGAQIYLGRVGRSLEPTSLGWIIGHVMPPWIVVAAFAPAPIWLAGRFPLRGAGWRNFAIHLGAMALFAFTRLTVLAAVHVLLRHAPSFTADAVLQLSSYFVWDCLIYWCLVGATAAVHSAQEARARELRETTLTAELSQARLEALTAQLSPHFFFNVLNTVSGLIAQQRGDDAMEVLSRLSDHMRLMLRSQPNEIPLDQELAFLRGYLDLQSVRFGSLLAISWHVSPEARDGLVPPLILQPLVENAVRHAVSTTGRSSIVVRARRMNGTLELAVEDDGPGLPEHWDLARAAGSGLRLTLERLQHAGRGGTLTLRSGSPRGTVASISLPWRA